MKKGNKKIQLLKYFQLAFVFSGPQQTEEERKKKRKQRRREVRPTRVRKLRTSLYKKEKKKLGKGKDKENGGKRFFLQELFRSKR